MAFSTGLSPAIWKWLRADRDSGGISRKAEGMLPSIVDAGKHDGPEGSPHVFSRSGHGATVELDAIGFELFLLAEERHAEAELLDDDVREHAGGEQPASNQQGRQGRGDDGEALVVPLDDSCIICTGLDSPSVLGVLYFARASTTRTASGRW
ncbi:MAG TPA: hypothetical protein VJV79_01805 [Polyangiaceae bacterium]|nr:hypothetical protein [Polyangiaceae bacterium]